MFIRILAFAVVSLLVAGCAKSGGGSALQANGDHSWTVPGRLRMAIMTDVKNLNPLLNSNTTDVFIDMLMFEPLVSANQKGTVIPMLAAVVPSKENGGISADGLTITYHLRPDAKWSDGVPVSSTDVKWSWQAIMNPNNNVISRHGYDFIRSIDTPDAHTVVVHLKTRFAPFVNSFFAPSDQPFPVAPAHILAKYPNINQIPFNDAPTVSDGPFTFVSWQHGDHIELKRNDAFFMGKPKLKSILIRIIPDENTAVNALRSHDIDWIFEASANNYKALSTIPDVSIVRVDVNGYEYLQLNTQSPALRDVRVRRAISYGIDKARLVQTLTFGQMQAATADIPPWLWAYDPTLQSDPYDPAKARALLESAGWKPGKDGMMRKNGRPLELTLTVNPSNITRRQGAVQIQAMLATIGIDVHVKSYAADILFAPVGDGGILQGGKFDIEYAGWYAGIDPDDSSQLMCENVAPNGYNYSRYCSKAMDAAQNDALSHYSQAQRKIAYAKIQKLIIQDAPMIVTYWERQIQPISVDFKGFAPNPVTEGWNAWEWSI